MNLNEFTYFIVDHFDDIKSQIDINVETLLCDTGLNEEDRKRLNDIREKQLEKIDQVQQASLSQLYKRKSEPTFENELSYPINHTSLDSNNKMERVLSQFILNDLILVENSNLKHRQVLCIIPGYLNKKKKQFKK